MSSSSSSQSLAPPDRLSQAIDRHYDVLWRFLRRLGVPEGDVEDAAQRVLLIFAQRLTTVEQGKERAFLLGSALRVASDVRKSQKRSRVIPYSSPSLDELPSSNIGADEQIDDHRRRMWLDEVLDALPDDLRAVLVLVDLEEQTMAEASIVLGIASGTVASRLRRARDVFETQAQVLKARVEGIEEGTKS